MAKANFDQFFDKALFLRGIDVRDKTKVTIECFEVNRKSMRNGKPQPQLKLEGFEAPLGLNQTNFNKLVELFGDETDRWAKKVIMLRTVATNNPTTGEDTVGIRIQAVAKGR